jgi:hypothetical protein
MSQKQAKRNRVTTKIHYIVLYTSGKSMLTGRRNAVTTPIENIENLLLLLYIGTVTDEPKKLFYRYRSPKVLLSLLH